MKDLDKPAIMAKGEIGFLNFIVIPLWKLMASYIGDEMTPSINNLDDSIKQWKIIQEAHKEEPHNILINLEKDEKDDKEEEKEEPEEK